MALLLLLATAIACASGAASSKVPRLIISILVDDLGAYDLGFSNANQIRTPALDRLRSEGVELTRMYVQPICTPSRSSFLTSRYALALGLQGKQTVQQGCAWGLDVQERTFVQALQGAGWSTHMVGKAHLGGDRWSRTPTWRGFNTFLGYLYGAEDYYTHRLAGYYDLRRDSSPHCGPGCSVNIGAASNGTYSTPLLAAEVVRLVAAAAASPAATPTYIHFTPQAAHAPLQAPEEYTAPYRPQFGPHNQPRAVHAGTLACLDAAMANITAAIESAGLTQDTLILLEADNGGSLGSVGDGTMSSNYPLRGGKHSLYEGGVRATAFAWGPAWLGAGSSNSTWDGLVHIVDVGPTLLEAAGVAPLPPLPGRPTHGVSFWGPLLSGAPSARASVVVNVDYTPPSQAAIVTREGMKLILGQAGDASCNYWSDPVGLPGPPPEGADPVAAPAAPAPAAPAPSPPQLWPLADMTPTLYNLTADPRESRNVSAAHPELVAALLAELAGWGGGVAVPVVENATADPAADPRRFNDSWTPWLGV